MHFSKFRFFCFVNRPTAHSNTMLIHTFLKGNVEQIIQLLWMLGCWRGGRFSVFTSSNIFSFQICASRVYIDFAGCARVSIGFPYKHWMPESWVTKGTRGSNLIGRLTFTTVVKGSFNCEGKVLQNSHSYNPSKQGGRSWQAFGERKKCPQFFRRTRIC